MTVSRQPKLSLSVKGEMFLPSPQAEGAPRTSKGLSVANFSFKSEKTYQWSQLGKIDPKDYRNKGNGTKRVQHVLYRLV